MGSAAHARRKKQPCPAVCRSGEPCPNRGWPSDDFYCHIHKVGSTANHGLRAEPVTQITKRRKKPYYSPATRSLRQEGYTLVQCEGVTRSGDRCQRRVRAMFGQFCEAHGGGRQGAVVAEALRRLA